MFLYSRFDELIKRIQESSAYYLVESLWSMLTVERIEVKNEIMVSLF